MNVVVLGPGAVGSLLGGLLALAGHRVTLLGIEGGAAIPGRLTLHRPGGGSRIVDVMRAGDPAAIVGVPDLVVLAVRQFDVIAALASIERWPQAPVLTVQNGIGAEEEVLRRRPEASLVAASLTAPVEVAAPGEVGWLSQGGIGLAWVRRPASGQGDLVERLATEFTSAGLRAAIFANPRAMKWSKLLANLVGNATSALLDEDPAAVYADPRLFRVEHSQLRETVRVMRAMGLRPVRLPGADSRLLAVAAALPASLVRPVMTRIVGGARGGKMPSLRLHLRSGGGPSEVGWMNGAVASAAERLGMAAPVNTALAALVEEASSDAGRRQELRGNRAALLAAVHEAVEATEDRGHRTAAPPR